MCNDTKNLTIEFLNDKIMKPKSLLYLLPFVLGFTGCEQETSSPKMVAGFSTPNIPSTYNQVIYNTANEKVMSSGINMVLTNASGKISTQKAQLSSMAYQKFNTIVIEPINIDSIHDEIAVCKQTGIPVILLNATYCDGIDAVISADYEDAARQAAEYLAQNMPDGADYSIFYTDGTSNANVALLTQGITNTLDPAIYMPNLNNGAARYCASESSAKLTASALLRKNVNAFIAYDDVTAKGIYSALTEAGKENEVILINISGSPEAKSMVADGKLDATIAISPAALGDAIAQVTIALSHKQATDQTVLVEATLIDKNNINEFDLDSWN